MLGVLIVKWGLICFATWILIFLTPEFLGLFKAARRTGNAFHVFEARTLAFVRVVAIAIICVAIKWVN